MCFCRAKSFKMMCFCKLAASGNSFENSLFSNYEIAKTNLLDFLFINPQKPKK